MTVNKVDYVIKKLCSLVTRLRSPTPVCDLAEDDGDLPPQWRV